MKKYKVIIRLSYGLLIVLGLFSLLATGCKTVTANQESQLPVAYDPRSFDPNNGSDAKGNPQQNTSLWAENNNQNWLFTDNKANRVGDIVTINVIESSKAKKKAKTTLSRGNETYFGISGLFGLENALPRMAPEINLGSLIGAKGKNNFTGSGETERSGELVARMGAIVTQQLPNGNLIIEGKRQVRVNNEEQVLVLSGVIRPRDISSDNSIPSYLIADARIYYSGEGVINDKQKPGWLSRGLDKITPF